MNIAKMIQKAEKKYKNVDTKAIKQEVSITWMSAESASVESVGLEGVAKMFVMGCALFARDFMLGIDVMQRAKFLSEQLTEYPEEFEDHIIRALNKKL